MDPPPAPFASSSASSPPPPSQSLLSSNASITMVIITVVGIIAAFALLASYYAFVTKCQLLRAFWSRHPPWHRRARGGGGAGAGETSVIRAGATGDRGLGLPLIRMLPVVKFTAEGGDGAAGYTGGGGMAARISVSECAVCLSEFVERERVRLLPNCSHAFHIDCIDTWLQGSARCPFCRSDVTLPAAPPVPARSALTPPPPAPSRHRRDGELAGDNSIVIEVRGEHERWVRHGTGAGTPAGRRLRQKHKAESVGDEAIDTRKDKTLEVQPLRRSLSMNSSWDKQHLYVSVQEFLATQRQACNPSVH
ncbi:hypothetical protein ACP4OV_004712 [Aristida adscensionis]